jgi:hypothetical protein
MPYVQPEPEKPRGEGGAGDRASISQAVKDYYEAVGREGWAYTYDNLDSQTRAMFTEEELRSRTNGSRTTRSSSLPQWTWTRIRFGGIEAEVPVYRTLEDDSSISVSADFTPTLV